MLYAHIENDTVTGVYPELPQNWRNVSNLNVISDETVLKSLGWRIVKQSSPSYDFRTQELGEPTYSFQDDTVIEIIPVIEKTFVLGTSSTDSENPQQHLNAMIALRSKRNELLKETDYTQLSDVSKLLGEDEMKRINVYRQRLRDLPSQYENDLSFVDVTTAVFPGK